MVFLYTSVVWNSGSAERLFLTQDTSSMQYYCKYERPSIQDIQPMTELSLAQPVDCSVFLGGCPAMTLAFSPCW